MFRKTFSKRQKKSGWGTPEINLPTSNDLKGSTRELTAFHVASYSPGDGLEEERNLLYLQARSVPERKERYVHTVNVSVHSQVPSEIGVALGSPRESFTAWEYDTSSRDDQLGSHTHISSGNSIPASYVPKSKPMRNASKRDKLRRALSRRNSDAHLLPQPPLPLSPRVDEPHLSSDDLADWPLPPTCHKGTRNRSKTHPSPKLDKVLPIAPVERRPYTSDGRKVSGSPAHSHMYPHQSSHAAPLFLDVDIPRIEMERYSIMFGSLLKRA